MINRHLRLLQLTQCRLQLTDGAASNNSGLISQQSKGKYNNMKNSKLSVGLVMLAIVMVTGTTFADQVHSAPDAGSSALLVSMAFAGLAVVRKFMR